MPRAANIPLVLIVRDGWGENPNRGHDAFNAVRLAKTPTAHELDRAWPRTLIRTCGEDVGLPEGTVGNSEVGHQNIGAGRIVDQESVAITKACRAGTLRQNAVLVGAIELAKQRGRPVHLMGLASEAGVHARLSHLYALLELCKQLGQSNVLLHLFTDGRDTGPFTGAGFVDEVQQRCDALGVGRIVSVMGRYFAMDRDNRWERVAWAYACLTGRGERVGEVACAPSGVEAVKASYAKPLSPTQEGDEFVVPTFIAPDAAAAGSTRITDGDCVIFYNYRGDRPRELIQAFVLPELENHVPPSPDSKRRGFDRGEKLRNLELVTLTRYWDALDPYVRVAFPKPPPFVNILGEVLSKAGLRQLRCAETEKYPHVTFFFNDYREEPFKGETRMIVQSPRVATYDLAPEMSAYGVRDAVLASLSGEDAPEVFIVNFANADMVGHTGSLKAAVRACEVVDECVGTIMRAVLERGGSLIITADHGNAEQMWDPEAGAPHTSHTLYDVPLYVVGEKFRNATLRGGGRLADIAPTMLAMLGLSVPAEMTGRSLLV